MPINNKHNPSTPTNYEPSVHIILQPPTQQKHGRFVVISIGPFQGRGALLPRLEGHFHEKLHRSLLLLILLLVFLLQLLACVYLCVRACVRVCVCVCVCA